VKIQSGTKVTISIANGQRFPGVVVEVEEPTTKSVVNRTTNALVEIVISRAMVITQRVSRAGETYLALTSEVNMYGYRPIMEPRFSTVVGLDATPEGEKITLQGLLDQHGESFSKWQEANFAARNTVVDADDL
jgi:hypothetical protein